MAAAVAVIIVIVTHVVVAVAVNYYKLLLSSLSLPSTFGVFFFPQARGRLRRNCTPGKTESRVPRKASRLSWATGQTLPVCGPKIYLFYM
jgi:hypothetical protein